MLGHLRRCAPNSLLSLPTIGNQKALSLISDAQQSAVIGLLERLNIGGEARPSSASHEGPTLVLPAGTLASSGFRQFSSSASSQWATDDIARGGTNINPLLQMPGPPSGRTLRWPIIFKTSYKLQHGILPRETACYRMSCFQKRRINRRDLPSPVVRGPGANSREVNYKEGDGPQRDSFWGPGRSGFKLRGVHMSPKKVNMFAKLIRGMHVEDALAQCNVSPKKSSQVCLKVLLLALKNAESNNGLDRSRLFIEIINVGRGTHLKRLWIHAKLKSGVRKRYRSHVEIVLKEGDVRPKQKYRTPLLERRRKRFNVPQKHNGFASIDKFQHQLRTRQETRRPELS